MINFPRRMEKILLQIESLPGAFYWISEDGSRVPAEGANDPLAFMTYPYSFVGGTPAVFPVSWGYTGAKNDIDPISESLFEEALNMASFIKRIESIKKELNTIAPSVTVIYAGGKSESLPLDAALQGLLWNPETIARVECDESGSGRLSELLQGLKDQVGGLEFSKEEPITTAPPLARR